MLVKLGFVVIQAADGVEGVAEEIEANRLRGGGWKDVDHAPPDGELTLFGNCRRTNITVHSEVTLKLGDRHIVADLGPETRLTQNLRRRQTLQDPRSGGDNDQR